MPRTSRVLMILALAACGGDSSDTTCRSWQQWGNSAEHRGASCVAGQDMVRMITTVPFDSLLAAEKEDSDGELLVHYQAPLVVDDDVYMEFKAGIYTPCTVVEMVRTCDLYRRSTQVWAEKGYRWESGQLNEKWMFPSDWKPMPSFGGFEPMFQPAVSGDFIYVPGAGGNVHKLRRADGIAVGRIEPFGATVDPDRYVTGALTVDENGTLYYNTVKLNHDHPYDAAIESDVQAHLVKVGADGKIQMATYQSLVTGAPAPTDLCRGAFNARTTPRPWPPSDDENGNPTLPPATFLCLSQRSSWNVAPAIGADGTIYTVSRAHVSDRTSFVVAVKPDLTPKWTRSLKGIFNDGCGGEFWPIDGDADHPFDCRIGARVGVDPNTNEMPSGRATDDSSSSPVALPDGSVLYGTFTGYNISRGHMVKLDASGAILKTFGFGWDVTPAVWEHDGTYSIVTKDNYYTFDENGVDAGPYFIRQLNKDLVSEWTYQNKNTQSCARDDAGQVACVEDHPAGFEWCINAPAIDKNGVVYVNSEDGNIYALNQGGTVKQQIFVSMAVAAAYTPLALDSQGRIITLNNGKMTAIGK